MIEVLHLFPKLNYSLIEVLENLSPDQWNKPTLCKKWNVKDIAAHLLDTALRRISSGRDGFLPSTPQIHSYDELLNYLNMLNADWVKAYQRISPQVIIDQLKTTQLALNDHLNSLDLTSKALFPVSWAGEEQSLAWFDIAREYTERWHHQQQIREAVGASSILSNDLYHPFLEVSLQALPYHYSSIDAPEGSVINIHIVGEAGGVWSIKKAKNAWQFTESADEGNTKVYIDQNIAWMLFSRGIDILEAEQYWQIIGNYELGFHALKMKAFMV